MFWWTSLLVQLMGVIFVVLSADSLFRNKKPRLDGRRSPEEIGDKRLVWFVFAIGVALVFLPYLLNPFLMPIR